MPAPGGGPAQGGSAPGAACSGEVGGVGLWRPSRPKADGYCCGRYASYWTKNALANSGNSQIKYLFNHGMIKLRAPIGRFCSLVENVFF